MHGRQAGELLLHIARLAIRHSYGTNRATLAAVGAKCSYRFLGLWALESSGARSTTYDTQRRGACAQSRMFRGFNSSFHCFKHPHLRRRADLLVLRSARHKPHRVIKTRGKRSITISYSPSDTPPALLVHESLGRRKALGVLPPSAMSTALRGDA